MKFASQGTEDIYNGVNSRAARATLPTSLHTAAAELLDRLVQAKDLTPFQKVPGLRYEALKGDRLGQHSIRINRQYRICFGWTGEEMVDLEIVDYH